MVYVASYKQLAVFGLTSHAAVAATLKQPSVVPAPGPAGAQFWGKIKSIHGSRITVVLRTGKLLQVDLSEALAQQTTVDPVIGENVAVNGRLNKSGVLKAHVMMRAKAPVSWGPDKTM
jgi:hypothetical protein